MGHWGHPKINREEALEMLTKAHQEITVNHDKSVKEWMEILKNTTKDFSVQCPRELQVHGQVNRNNGNRLKNILATMRKIEDGTWGICEDCKKPIPEGRLWIHPEATLCVECKSIMESYTKIKGVPDSAIPSYSFV